MDRSENPKATQTDEKKDVSQKKRSKHWLRTVLFTELIYISVLFAVLALFVALYASESGIRVPTWIEGRFQAAIDDNTQDFNLDYADAYLKLEEDFRPKLLLTDATLSNETGEVIARLSQLQVKMTRQSIFTGDPKIQSIQATGLYATVRRIADGSLNWSLAQESAVSIQIPTLQDADVYLEQLFASEPLRDLNEIHLEPITIRYEDAVTNRAYTADGGVLRVTKDQDAITLNSDVTVLSDQGEVSRALVRFDSDIGSQASDLSVSFDEIALRDLIVQSQYFGVMSPITGRAATNLRLSVSSDGTLSPLNLQLSLEEGVLTLPQLPQVPFDSFQAYLTLYPTQERLDIVQVKLDSPQLTTEFSAQVQLDQSNGASDIYGSLSATRLEIRDLIPQVGDLELARFETHFKTSLSESRIDILGAKATLPDRPAAVFADASWDGQAFGVDVMLRDVTRQDVLEFWPENIAPKAYDWVNTRINGVSLGDIQIAARYDPNQPTDLSYFLTAPVRAEQLSYSRTLPPATDIKGTLQIYDKTLVVHASQGRIPMGDAGDIIGQTATFEITDLTAKPATGDLRLRASGPVEAVSTYLNTKPLALMDKANLPAVLGTGQVEATLDLTIPLIKKAPKEDIVYQGNAQITGFASQTIVAGRTISSPSLTLAYSNEAVTVQGPASFDDVSGTAELNVSLPNGTPEVTFSSSITPQTLRNLGIDLSFADLDGRTSVSGLIAFPKGQPPTLALRSDLSGMKMHIPMLDWTKSQSTKGTLKAAITLARPIALPNLRLSANGLEADLSIDFQKSGKLDKVILKNVALSGLGKISGVYLPARAGIAQFAVAGGTLDFRRFVDGQGGMPNPSGPARTHRAVKVTGQLDRLILHDKLTVQNAKITSENIAKLIQLDGKLGGTAVVRSTVFNMGERIEVTAPDAGQVLDAMNVTTQIKDGSLRLALDRSVQHGGYDGALHVETFRLIKAPVLANVLNTVSIIGILEQLNGEGVHFGELDAQFSIRPDAYALHSMSAIGASMGISLRGKVSRATDTTASTMVMDGVVSPFYMLNAIGAPISRKGEGLFGVTFALQGPSADPKIRVNPLSLLTPGPLREIFRKQINTTE